MPNKKESLRIRRQINSKKRLQNDMPCSIDHTEMLGFFFHFFQFRWALHNSRWQQPRNLTVLVDFFINDQILFYTVLFCIRSPYQKGHLNSKQVAKSVAIPVSFHSDESRLRYDVYLKKFFTNTHTNIRFS